MTRVSVMLRKVTVKIGDAENRCRWCRDKNQWKRAKIPVRLVLSRVPFKYGVWNLAYKMPKNVLSLLVKPKLKMFCLLCATDCSVLEVKGKINVKLPSDVINRSKSIDLTINLFRFVVHSKTITRLDNLTKIQSSKHGFLYEMHKCCIFRCALK